MIARCACGNVELHASGEPIMSVACYCDDCQLAGRDIEALPDAPRALQDDGSTEYLVCRKDRVSWPKGFDLLGRQKIREESSTFRFVASCCHSAVALGFEDSKPWVSVWRSRVEGDTKPVEMCVCTKFRRQGVILRSDVPVYPRYSARFARKILASQIARLFGR
jgi:hypothetical protein